ncbi:MAG: MFS transporter [Rhodospirillaceae bacterium]|jgi:MFS transporter, DHA1 family, multidrug resistance protein|nr:MFS transporter [Rhodospirillaceae bacterium]MBT5195046.1 MFS transporter [Rhodospirillaceae bacterium]MBT5895670.1 MFS transporter [Rhodospirillaceae bacterium]MBT6429814.1 MFS transporter [Rhodospirillaceae bacterium]MBT7757194.1 MFS transporter [Rhodospirillaceae bacterium]
MTVERRVLLAMCGLITINQLGFGSVIPVLPLYAQSFGVPASAIGMAVAIYGLARFFVAMPSGHLSDRLGRRPTLAIGGVISAAGSFWCAAATGYPEFIVARFISGAGAGIILTTGQVVLADISTPERRGRIISIYQGCFLFAVGIGPLPGGLLATHFGLATPFQAYGTASLLAALVAWSMVKETKDLGLSSSGHGGGQAFSYMRQVRLLMGQVGFVLVSIVSLTNAITRTGGLFTIIPVFVSMRLGLSVAEIGFGMALGTVAGVFAAYPAGVLVDRFGRKSVIVPATLITGASMLLFMVAPDFLWFVISCTIWGISASVGGSAPAAYAADSAPPGMNAAAMSTFRMVGDLGYVIGPIALGLVVDLRGPQDALLLTAAISVVIGFLFLKYAPETHRGGK